jgi:hypothetical protein
MKKILFITFVMLLMPDNNIYSQSRYKFKIGALAGLSVIRHRATPDMVKYKPSYGFTTAVFYNVWNENYMFLGLDYFAVKSETAFIFDQSIERNYFSKKMTEIKFGLLIGSYKNFSTEVSAGYDLIKKIPYRVTYEKNGEIYYEDESVLYRRHFNFTLGLHYKINEQWSASFLYRDGMSVSDFDDENIPFFHVSGGYTFKGYYLRLDYTLPLSQ